MNSLTSTADTLRQDLHGLTFPKPVSHPYNPLKCAWDRHCEFATKLNLR